MPDSQTETEARNFPGKDSYKSLNTTLKNFLEQYSKTEYVSETFTEFIGKINGIRARLGGRKLLDLAASLDDSMLAQHVTDVGELAAAAIGIASITEDKFSGLGYDISKYAGESISFVLNKLENDKDNGENNQVLTDIKNKLDEFVIKLDGLISNLLASHSD